MWAWPLGLASVARPTWTPSRSETFGPLEDCDSLITITSRLKGHHEPEYEPAAASEGHWPPPEALRLRLVTDWPFKFVSRSASHGRTSLQFRNRRRLGTAAPGCAIVGLGRPSQPDSEAVTWAAGVSLKSARALSRVPVIARVSPGLSSKPAGLPSDHRQLRLAACPLWRPTRADSESPRRR